MASWRQLRKVRDRDVALLGQIREAADERALILIAHELWGREAWKAIAIARRLARLRDERAPREAERGADEARVTSEPLAGVVGEHG